MRARVPVAPMSCRDLDIINYKDESYRVVEKIVTSSATVATHAQSRHVVLLC
jgi:hypothetical protein